MHILAVLLILAVPTVMDNSVSGKTTVYNDSVIHVHKSGNDNESCLTGQDIRQGKRNQYCETLEFVANKLQNSGSRNVTIILESKIQVSSAVNFSDHEHLTLQGRNKHSTSLSCRCNKADSDSIGISFIRITNLKINGFSVIYCCGVINNYNAGMFIQDSSYIIIEESQIRNNERSNGLIITNPSSLVTI